MSRLREMIQELCPDGVAYRKLGEIAHYVRERIKVSEIDVCNYVGVEHLRQNTEGREMSVTLPDADFVIAFRSEDILIGNIRPYLKKAWLADCNGGTNGDVLTIRIDDKMSISPQYLFYILSSERFFSYDMKYAKGAKMPRGDKKAVMNYEIPVPPLPIQNEIVKMLDNFTELTAERALRKKQYEWYGGSLIGGATFPKRKISDIATFRYGYTTSAATSGDARYIRITDITDDGKLNPLDAKYTCISTENKEYLLKRDDLVMARTGATYGKTLCYNMDTPAIYASFLIKIQVDETQMLPRFYWHFTRTPEYWGQANRLVTKGGQPQFNTGAIGRIVIPIPPLEVQAKIVSILDRFDTLTSDLTQGLPAEIAARKKQYEYYRDKLLTFRRKGA